MLLVLEDGELLPITESGGRLAAKIQASSGLCVLLRNQRHVGDSVAELLQVIEGEEFAFIEMDEGECEVVRVAVASSAMKTLQPAARSVVAIGTDVVRETMRSAHFVQWTALSMLTGTFSHDFNNLLGAADGAVSLLLRSLSGDEKNERRLSLVAQSLKRSVDLSQELGLLIPKECRQMRVIAGEELLCFLQEEWRAQLHDFSLPAHFNAELSTIMLRGSDVVTRGLFAALLSVFPLDSHLQSEVDIVDLAEEKLAELGSQLKGGSFFRMRITCVNKPPLSAEVLCRFRRHIGAGVGAGFVGVRHLLAAHRGVSEGLEGAGIKSVTIYLPVSRS